MASTYLLAKLNSSTDAPSPRDPVVKGLLTALGALIPAEVIAASSTIAGYLTKTDDTGAVTWSHVSSARLLMFVLGLVVIPLMYMIGADHVSGRPAWRTIALVVISMAAYAGWLAIQTPTVYQGWFGADGELSDAGARAAYLTVVVLVLGLASGWIGATNTAGVKEQPSDGKTQ